ncbi:unannotated protein [freshwater metagenome]|uniref:Unannotated protein n=1 Tax=freshwater metagenome TaxID=449393 RepID=A0A6J6RNT5_9ZZZZ
MAATGAEPETPISPRRAPTATVVSTATSIARSVPATGEGISVSTLSVETSRSASSTATESPTFLSQRVTVPSLTDSPSAGIVMTVPPPDAAGATTGAAGGGVGATGAAMGAATTGAATGAATTGAATGAGAEAPALSAITASSAPTATVWSTPTTIFVRIPATGEGISVSTLSVETSRSGSSTATMSPSFLSQRVTVPSLTLSPRAGIVTENDIAIFSSYLTVRVKWFSCKSHMSFAHCLRQCWVCMDERCNIIC